MIPCPHTLEELNAYIDGELQLEEHRSVRRHLKTCTACQHSIETLTTVKEMVTHTAAVYPLPPTLRRAVSTLSLPSRRRVLSLFTLLHRQASPKQQP